VTPARLTGKSCCEVTPSIPSWVSQLQTGHATRFKSPSETLRSFCAHYGLLNGIDRILQ